MGVAKMILIVNLRAVMIVLRWREIPRSWKMKPEQQEQFLMTPKLTTRGDMLELVRKKILET